MTLRPLIAAIDEVYVEALQLSLDDRVAAGLDPADFPAPVAEFVRAQTAANVLPAEILDDVYRMPGGVTALEAIDAHLDSERARWTADAVTAQAVVDYMLEDEDGWMHGTDWPGTLKRLRPEGFPAPAALAAVSLLDHGAKAIAGNLEAVRLHGLA